MRKHIAIHLGLWILAFALLGGLAIASLDPASKALPAVTAGSTGGVVVLRHQKAAMQDPEGRHTVYRAAVARGHY